MRCSDALCSILHPRLWLISKTSSSVFTAYPLLIPLNLPPGVRPSSCVLVSCAHDFPSVTIITRSCVIIADLLIIFITYHTIPRYGWASGRQSTFATVLLRDGVSFFAFIRRLQTSVLTSLTHRIQAPHTSCECPLSMYDYTAILMAISTLFDSILLVLNLLHLIFTVVSVCVTGPLTSPNKSLIMTHFQISAPFQAASYVILFLHPYVLSLSGSCRLLLSPHRFCVLTVEPIDTRITGILVSRFLFDLQSANRCSLHLDSARSLSCSCSLTFSSGSISFARVVGSLGSSLPPPYASHASTSYPSTSDWSDLSDTSNDSCDCLRGIGRDTDIGSVRGRKSEATPTTTTPTATAASSTGPSPKPSLVIHINRETQTTTDSDCPGPRRPLPFTLALALALPPPLPLPPLLPTPLRAYGADGDGEQVERVEECQWDSTHSSDLAHLLERCRELDESIAPLRLYRDGANTGTGTGNVEDVAAPRQAYASGSGSGSGPGSVSESGHDSDSEVCPHAHLESAPQGSLAPS